MHKQWPSPQKSMLVLRSPPFSSCRPSAQPIDNLPPPAYNPTHRATAIALQYGKGVDTMAKTDKELAVDFASAYVSAWFSRPDIKKPMDGVMIKALIEESYSVIHALDRHN